MRISSALRRAAIAAALLTAAGAAMAPPPASAGQAVALRQNPAHTGATSEPGVAPPLRQLWSAQLGMQGSLLYRWYPIVADGRVFVPMGVDGDTADVVALDGASGTTLWRRSSRYAIGLGYDGGTLFVNADDHGVQALDPATGAVRWASDWGSGDFLATPTAADGRVVVGGPITVALRQSDGALLWKHEAEKASDGYAALVGGRIFVNFVGPQTYELDPETGEERWHHAGPLYGGGLPSIAVADGRIWASAGTDSPGDVVTLDGGRPLGHFPAEVPAVTSSVAVFPDGTALQAEDPASRAVRWRRDVGARVRDPLVVDGTVYAALEDGRVVGLSLDSGQVVWSAQLPAPGIGLAAGDGRLIVVGYGWVTAFAGPPSSEAPPSAGAPTAAAGTPPPAASPSAPAVAGEGPGRRPTVSVARTSLRAALRSGLRVRMTGMPRGRLVVRALRGRRVAGRAAVHVPVSGRATARLRLSRGTRRALAQRRRVTLVVRADTARTRVVLRRRG